MKLFGLILLAGILLAGCTTIQPPAKPALEHVVLFWLKEPGNAAQRQQIIAASKRFEQIPAVIAVHTGTAMPSERAIVDDSFDVGIIVTVAGREGLQQYLDHPIHVDAKNGVLLPLVEKVLVYDIE